MIRTKFQGDTPFFPNMLNNGNIEVSLKEDVDKTLVEKDKVIAEKDKEIQRLENLCESYRIDCDNLAIREANAYKDIERYNKQIRHNKYKRCLDKAKWCEAEVRNIRRTPLCDMGEHEGWQHDDEFWQRWHKRWLELAEKFKEAK